MWIPIQIELLASDKNTYTIEDLNSDTFLTLSDGKRLINIGVDYRTFYCMDENGRKYEYAPLGITAMIVNYDTKRYNERITVSNLFNNRGIIQQFLSETKGKEFYIDIADPFRVLLSSKSEYILVLPDFILLDERCKYYDEDLSYLVAYINNNYTRRLL